MLDYRPPFSITDAILMRVASIAEKISGITATNRLESRPHLLRNNRIRSIHASLKIEANSLTLGQVRDVLGGKLVLGEQKEIQEVKNAYAAYEILPEIDIFDAAQLCALHGVMTKGLVEESGVFRSGEEGVFRGEECIFMAPPARLVPTLMEQLLGWMQRENSTVHPLILSSVFHYEFVFIHPFSDGNGRMARLWHTAILASWHPLFAYLPLESHIERCQEEYYAAIDRCHSLGHSTPFIEFMLEQIDAMLDETSAQLAENSELLSAYTQKLLAAMEYDVPYTGRALREKLGMKSMSSFRKHYLQPALELGLIRMTLPDTPNSRNQRYIRT